MKTPSRYMPKRNEPETAGIGSYMVLVGFILLPAIFILYKDQSKFAFIFLGIFYGSIVGFGYIVGVINNINFRKLSTGRDQDSICTFARHFDCRSVDTWIIRAVYEEIIDLLGQEFPIRPTDNIFKDLNIDSDDLEMDFETDLVGTIAQRTGRSLQNMEQNPYYGKVNTAEDLVMFFNNQPKIVVA